MFGCPHFVSRAELGNPWMDFFNFGHTHPSGGVDVRFQVGIFSAKFQLVKILNGRLSAIIVFNMPDIRQTMPDSWTIITKENVQF